MTTTAIPTPATASERRRAGKYLTFFLAGEEYALEILAVNEIIGVQPITRVPRTPPYVRGVINLRGKVISIVDLRAKFGLEPATVAETVIIVVQVHGVPMGVLVDRVSEVVSIAEGDVEETPSFGADVETDYLLGIGKVNGRVRLLLDIERVLSTQDICQMPSIADLQSE
ncbi:MAG TPA: chemotaxis protein CheW [Gemmatimonadaceae bacterium]